MNFDEIYADISTKVLPKVAEGFAITKDYAFDLFERYINYLIITDSILTIVYLSLTIATIVFGVKMFRLMKKEKRLDDDGILLILPIIFGIFLFGITFDKAGDLVKDIFFPEVRIYELYKGK